MLRRVVGLLVMAVVLVGCADSGARDTSAQGLKAEATTTPTTESPTTTAPPTDEGPIAKRIGDLAGAGCTDQSFKNCAIVFTITKITGCKGAGYPGDPPPAGTTRKLVWVEIRTSPTYDPVELPSYLITTFSAISADEVTTGGQLNPSTGWECAPPHESMGFGDEDWLPNKKYAGAVEIYLPDDAAKITNGEGFWEWALS